jgi:hypothetical protein
MNNKTTYQKKYTYYTDGEFVYAYHKGIIGRASLSPGIRKAKKRAREHCLKYNPGYLVRFRNWLKTFTWSEV